jgi:hypothetical protein
MVHRGSGAPLVSTTLMAHQLMVRHYYIVVAHQVSGAPLVVISSIALFLVVHGGYFEFIHTLLSNLLGLLRLFSEWFATEFLSGTVA